jgi:1-acyl-sn-glycerol-3-phosphate acyltransferase
VATTTTSRNGHSKVSAEKARGLFEDSRPELPEPDWGFIRAQQPVWNFLLDHYFRMEVHGWHRLPPAPALIVGIHSGGILPIDAYAFGFSWFREFGRERVPRATSHDFLMQTPAIGTYLSKIGSVPASHEGIMAALDGGQDVILYPGGDLDALRPWRKRDEVIFGGRKGWIRMALEAQVPIVPVANVGGSDTLFVLTEGQGLAKTLRLDKLLRAKTFPIGLGFPFGLLPASIPQIPLPAKLRSEILEPIYLDGDEGERFDDEYVERKEQEVVAALQAGVTRLAKRRSFPIFG